MGFFRFVKKTILMLGLYASIAYMGDRTNFNDRFVNPILYANRPVASQFYNPLEVQKRAVINDAGKLETYSTKRLNQRPDEKGIKTNIRRERIVVCGV